MRRETDVTQHGRGRSLIQASLVLAGLCSFLFLAPSFGTAQTSPPQSNQFNPQNQPGQSLQAPGTIPIPNLLAQQSAISSTASGASAP